MSEKRHKPITITPNFYHLSTYSHPVYLSLGDDGMLIEGGTGAATPIIVEQIKELGIEPKRIKYITLTHTHGDHIGSVLHLQKLWPHLKLVSSPVAARLLKDEAMIKDFIHVDRKIAEIMVSKGDVSELPPDLENYSFNVDQIVKEGDRLDLGSGIVWTIYETPGHSPCHISLCEKKEETLVIGDTTGFYAPHKNAFWPNYLESLENYCNSIRKLSTLSARRGALSHHGVIEGLSKEYFRKALKATESYHLEMMERLGKGEDPKQIALDKANWVSTLTDRQPYELMVSVARILMKRSQSESSKNGLFTLP